MSNYAVSSAMGSFYVPLRLLHSGPRGAGKVDFTFLSQQYVSNPMALHSIFLSEYFLVRGSFLSTVRVILHALSLTATTAGGTSLFFFFFKFLY